MAYAGFLRRFIAWIIDRFILLIGILFISMLGFMAKGSPLPVQIPFGFLLLTMVIMLLLYFPLMESSKYQGTIGKLALGMKVTDMEGNRIGFGRSVARNLCKIISGLFFFGYVMIVFNEKKQGFHDKIAGCLVLKKDPGVIWAYNYC